MLNRLLSLLIAAAIFGCPMECAFSTSCCAVEPAVVHSCCEHCQTKHGSESGDDSCPDDNQPAEKCCQGVCGGAVVEKRDAQSLAVDFTAYLAPAIAAVSSLELAVPREVLPHQVPLPDDGHNPGRLLRCQLSSFLC